MARLVDYDLYTQIAKVQSCFHQQYPPDTSPTEDVAEEETPSPPPPPPPATDTIDLISSESEAEEDGIAVFTPPDKPTSNGSFVKNNTASSGTTTRQEGMIDLTLDVEDEVDEIEYTQPGGTSSWDQDRQAPPSMDLKGIQHKSENVDQGHQAQPDMDMDGRERDSQEDLNLQAQTVPKSQQTAPMVQLLVDTQLLGPQKYELRALFEFSGQVIFDPTLEDDSNCLNIGSEARNERGPGQWVMLAKSARNMEGLDLYAYRESGQEPPAFERTQETAQFLRDLMELNQTQDSAAQETLHALEECSAYYRDEDAQLTEVIQAFGVTKDQLTPDTQGSLSHLAELGMILNLSDLTLPSFQQAFSLLRLDTLDPYALHAHEAQAARLDTHLARAEDELHGLVQLRDRLTRERDTHDMEIRNMRRSVELMKREFQQKTQEEQNQEQAFGEGGGDMEAQSLTVSQIKAQEAVVVALQDQLDVQTKNLAAYKEIPPDYTLATLKLNEANARLEQLSAEHESLVQRLADDL
ncbi:hypothetical protein BGZ93_002578 [Podila epicladia]|nr:hypothetical protein BGZ93_002578 [Podila epicladia]